MRTFLVSSILGSASGMSISHLRGAPGVEKKEEKAGKNTTMLNPVKIDERGPRGHFYYAQTCADCFYKGDECGCQPAVEYFACLTKHCHDSKTDFFAERCTSLGDKCFKDININCRGADTTCTSKFNQLPMGGLGFDLDIDEDDAYCGPHGKCIGDIELKAHIKNGPKEETEVKPPKVITMASPGSPAPGPMAAAAPAAVKPVKDDKEEKENIWLECGLPKKDHADIDDKHDWILCQQEVKGEKEKCKIPMFSELKAGANKKAYCVLTEGKDGKRLTQPHWSKVINVHEKAKPCATTAAEAPKAEKPKPAPAPKKEEKPKEEEAPLVMGNTHKLPWMVEKENRAAATKVAEAEDAKKAKDDKEEKEEKEKADKPAKVVENDSGLPWMKGKPNSL